MLKTSIIVPADLWEDFGKLARTKDLDRAKFLRKLIRDELAKAAA